MSNDAMGDGSDQSASFPRSFQPSEPAPIESFDADDNAPHAFEPAVPLLAYGTREPRNVPGLIHELLRLIWAALLVILYAGVIGTAGITAVAVVIAIYPYSGFYDVNGPTQTSWQRVQLPLVSAALLLVFSTALFFLEHRTGKSNR